MNVQIVAEKTFNLLKGFGFEVSSYNKEGDLVIDPMEATRFAVESPNVLVRIDPLDKHLSLKTGTPGESIEKLRPMLKELAQDYLLDFDYSVFDKQIKPKGEKVDVAKKSKEEIQMSEELNILKKLAGLTSESFDVDAEQSREEEAYEDLMAALKDGGEEAYAKACGLSMEELDQEMGEISRDLNLHMDDDRDEIIQRHAEDTVDNADWKDHGEPEVDEDIQTIQDLAGLEENPDLLNPPGSDIKFGQDRNELLAFNNEEENFFAMLKTLFDKGKLEIVDPISRRPEKPEKLNPDIARIALNDFFKKGEKDPASAYAQASAKMHMGYKSGDFSEQDTTQKVSEASLGKMTGSRKSSYQPLADNVKIIVRHNKDVNEEVRGARSRNIHSILIQRGEEKFKMAENNLSAARAMARHLHNGGETFDEIGEAITQMSREFKTLKEFVGYVRKAKLVNEDNEEFVSLALENINIIKNTFKRLSGVKSYANAIEGVQNYKNVEILQDDLDLEAKFTETHFDDKVANAMENLRAMSSRQKSFENHITKAIESETFAGIKDIIAEDDLLEFESLNQQLGHRVHALGNSASDTTLGKYLHSISDKLNAGGQLSQFEYGAVKSSLLSAGQHNVSNAPMSVEESYEAFMDRFVD